MSIKIPRPSVKRFVIVAILGIFLSLQLILSLPPQLASAKLEDPIHPVDQSRIWNATWHIYGCLWDPDDRHDIHEKRDESDLQAGSIFYNVETKTWLGTEITPESLINPTQSKSVAYTPGPILPTTSGNRDYLLCTTGEIAASFGALNLSPKEALSGSGSADIYKIEGDRFVRNGSGRDREWAESWASYINRQYPDLNINDRPNGVPRQQPQAEYFMLYKIFEKDCAGIQTGADDGGRLIKSVDENSGEITDKFYSLRDRSVAVPFGTLSCSDLVARLNERSDAASKAVKDWVAAGGTSFGGGSAEDVSCEANTGETSWILCPILRLAGNIVEKLDGAINSLLTTPNSYIENESLKLAWSRIRNIAYIVLIPVTLVMVISTILGFEFVSAYTIKRALPRLVAATIFIALSFEITSFLVILTNNIGTGISGLIMSPFLPAGENNIALSHIFNPSGENDLFSMLVVGIGGFGALAIGSIGVIGSYILVTLLAVMVGFLLLSFRQMLIIALMILAPVAILAWIFPGNDKLWKLWWGTFSKLLLLFPLIMLLIAVGRSFATLVNFSDGSDAPLIDTLIKLVAYMGPYFMIPAMFKFAGGVFATIAGMANDKERGLFDRQRKYRAQKMSQNWQDTKGGKRFSGTGSVSQFANRSLQRASHANKIGLAGLVSPRTARARLATATSGASMAAMQEDLEKNHEFAQIKNDDDLLSAGIRGGSEKDVREFLQQRSQALAQRGIKKNFSDQDVAAVMAARQALGNNFNQAAIIAKAGTGTGYAGEAGAGELTQDIINASRGDKNMENALFAAAKSQAANARRYDLQAGFGSFLNEKEQLREGNSSLSDVSAALTDSALDSQGAGAVLAGRGQSAANFVPALRRRLQGSWNDLQAAYGSGDVAQIEAAQRRFTQEVASTEALIDVAGQSSPENARMIADGVNSGVEFDLSSAPSAMRDWVATQSDGTRTIATSMTARNMMDHLGSRGGAYDEMRRNYSSSYQRDMAQQQASAGGPGVGPGSSPSTGIGP